MATWYVRTSGGTTTQCTGHTNANYPGSGTGQACAYSNLQDALDAATFGDTIKIHAGDTISTTPAYAFGEFLLPNKGTPPTNTDADYITITTDDPTGTPSALSGYPANGTRITTALAANMPHVIANGSTPLFRIKNGASYWKVERLDIHNNSANGWQTIVFIFNEDPGPTSLAQVPHHIVIQNNWIHPDEEVGTPLTSSNLARSAENAIYLSADTVTIQNNAIQGFVGTVRYGGNAGSRMTSAGILIASYAANLTIKNNLLEAWTYAFFAGGSAMPDWTVTEGSTIVSCTSPTSCTFASVAGLSIGDPLAVYVTSAATWGATYVSNIVGNVVTFNAALCHSYDGNNSCTTITGAPTPANGDPIRWNGLQPNNILCHQNIFAHYPEWAPLMDGDCGGKGYLEVKACVDCVFDGNVFTGCTGPTVTVRNQGGDFPWASLDGLTFSNNYWENSNRPFTSYLRDNSPTSKSQNVSWVNNLVLGLNGNAAFFPGGEINGSCQGGVNTTYSHNTVAWSKTNQPGMTLSGWHDYINYRYTITNGLQIDNTMQSFTFRDNIIPLGTNACFHDTTATQADPIGDCWPGGTVTNNVLVNADNWDTAYVNQWWLTTFPNNYTTVGYDPVQFRNPNSTLSAGGDYRLATSSPYHNAASDGTDIGYNHAQLVAALGFDPTGATWYASPTGSGTTCSFVSPCSLATVASGNSGTIQAGDTIYLRGGIYQVPVGTGLSFAVGGSSAAEMTVYAAYPGERPIITDTANNPPNIYMKSYQRLDGLWIGGSRQSSNQSGLFNGATPLSSWTQIVNCTFWGYYNGWNDSSAEYVLYQNNRFVRMGGGSLYHPVYISGTGTWPPVPGTLGTHHIVDGNLFVAGVGGYGIHFFHNDRTGIATRNFVNGNWGVVFDGLGVLVANNLMWKTFHPDTPATNPGIDPEFTQGGGIFINNITGLDSYFNPANLGVTINKNAFEANAANPATGTNPIILTIGQEATQIGVSASALDTAIANLNTSFSASPTAILADSTIETNFSTIKNITVPGASPLFHTGVPWYDSSPINVGPNSGAPTSVDNFWSAYYALGLPNYDSSGNLIPSQSGSVIVTGNVVMSGPVVID